MLVRDGGVGEARPGGVKDIMQCEREDGGVDGLTEVEVMTVCRGRRTARGLKKMHGLM